MVGVLLSGCFGYQPIYNKKNADFSRVHVEHVSAFQKEDYIGKGKRRTAQVMNRKLKELLTSKSAEFALTVQLEEDENALAVQRDATVERVELTSYIEMTLHRQSTGEEVFKTAFDVLSYYNIQDTPFATEASLERARLTAAEGAAEEVIHRLSMFLNQTKEN